MHSYIKDFKIANIFHINILSICWGLLKSGGLIVVDDVQKFAHKMVGFTETLEELGVDAEYLPTDADDSILFARKP